MNIARSLSLFALPLLLVACAGPSEDAGTTDSTEVSNTETASQDNAGEADKKMDPARDAAKTAEPAEPAGPTTSITFAENSHDFGTIDEGDVVTHIFTFTNTGDEPLILDRCKGSCGCTVPKYPKNTPIAPGDGGVIAVRFDSSGKPNLQQKTVTISANTSTGREMLRIKAMVTADPEKQRQREQAARARQNSNN